MMKGLLLILSILLAAGRTGPVLSESAKLPAGFQLITSYKKAGENNPLYTQRFGADPGVMEYDGRFYVYLTNDVIETGPDGKVKENTYSQIRHISCISSDDLVNWTDHGLIPVAGPDGIARWAMNSWAPCAAHKIIDGKERFFLYFCNGGNGIGVLTSDSPTGPWEDPLGHLLISRSVPNCANVLWLFDPAVMVDEDGTGYLAFGGGVPQGKQAAPGTGRIVRLAPDMIHLEGDPVTVDAPWLFEDSGINRIGGKYIYSYCSNWQTKGNALRLTDGAIQYMTSDNPLGPYTYTGELFPNEGRFFGLYGNNHHSIACLNGQYYLFYHSRPVEKAMKISGNYRSPQVDIIRIGEDGTLNQVTGTMKGPSQLKALNPYDGVSGCTMASQAGIQYEKGEGWQGSKGTTGSWIRIAGVDFGRGTERLTVSTVSETDSELYLMTGGPDGEVAAMINVPAGTEPVLTEAPLTLEGEQDICFVFGGDMTFINWKVQ
jgi:arabinoxylan arabinofuranohydrolase